MARKKLELRRQEILAAAAEQIRQSGIAATRVADVAAALGVSTALIFYHFETKERLLAETFVYASTRDLDELAEVCASPGSPWQRLQAVLELYGPTGDASGWVLWIDGWSGALRDPELLAVLRRLDRRWKTAISDLIREAADAGEVRCADPAEAAARIAAFLDGLAVAKVVRKDRFPARRITTWIADFVAAELGLAAAGDESARAE